MLKLPTTQTRTRARNFGLWGWKEYKKFFPTRSNECRKGVCVTYLNQITRRGVVVGLVFKVCPHSIFDNSGEDYQGVRNFRFKMIELEYTARRLAYLWRRALVIRLKDLKYRRTVSTTRIRVYGFDGLHRSRRVYSFVVHVEKQDTVQKRLGWSCCHASLRLGNLLQQYKYPPLFPPFLKGNYSCSHITNA